MKYELKEYIAEKKALIDNYLPFCINRLEAPDILKESMVYSLKAGGKRLRPILLFATLHAFHKKEEIGLDIACALEMIHTYSLIHDDLPSMDNDDLRRGLPTNHIKFGEATAILAGDGLLTYSFELIASSSNEELPPPLKIELIRKLAQAAGPEGMVGGQVADLDAEGKTIDLETLEMIHRNKTGRLLSFPIEAGAILAGAEPYQLEALQQFAAHLGLAFQIKDDILDIEGETEVIGKPIGSDTTNDKSTYPKLLTLQGAKDKCLEHLKQAKYFLTEAKVEATILEDLADYIVNRNM